MEPLLTATKIEAPRRQRAVRDVDAVDAVCAAIEGAASEPAPAHHPVRHAPTPRT
jgi:hypothetical protein